MSDQGTYAALEADLIAKITGKGGLVQIAPSLSLRDLITRDGIRKPAAGIIHTGATDSGLARGVGQPHRWANVTFQIAVAFNDLRGAVSSRPLAQAALEEIRDAVHFTQPTGYQSRWMWLSDVYPDEQPEGLIVATTNFSIPVVLGNS